MAGIGQLASMSAVGREESITAKIRMTLDAVRREKAAFFLWV
jgi:hypothetical protein